MPHSAQSAPGRRHEDGFILIAVLFLVALILIALAVAAPRIAKSIQLDREQELIERGNQYKRAVKLYYKKFGAYPSSIDQLVKTNQIRFLRKRYTDPMTGKDDWRPVYFGQVHIKTMGFFGQPIASSGMAGASLGGTNTGSGLFGASAAAAVGSFAATGSSSTLGSSSDPSSGSGADAGSDSGSTFGSDSGSNSSFGSNSSSGSGFSSNSASGSGFSSGSTGSAAGQSGSGSQLSGGGPIVGFVIPKAEASIKEYKQQKHYNQWEFVYDPLEEQMQAASLFGGSAPNVNGSTSGSTGGAAGSTNSGSTTPGFGSSTTGSGFGATTGSGFGSTGGSNPSPPGPIQQ
jgi:type II secretory pathway pseudopilin PulG